MRMLCFLVVLLSATSASAQKVAVKSTDGGSVQTPLGYNISVNSESSLTRSWITLSEPASPVSLEGTGVRTSYSDRRYRFDSVGEITAKVDIRAIEVRYVLLDIFGERLRTLSGLWVADLAKDKSINTDGKSAWYATENDVERFLTCVSFVAFVRTSDGRVWAANWPEITKALQNISTRATENFLEPSDEK